MTLFSPVNSERQNRLMAELDRLALECGDFGWNGYGACATSEESLRMAKAYARQLPEVLSLPLPAVDSQGRVMFQWGRLGGKFLSIKFGNSKEDPVVCIHGVGTALASCREDASDFAALNRVVEAYS